LSVNIAINGICGRMGLEIAKIVIKDEQLQLIAGFDAPSHPKMGEDIGRLCGIEVVDVAVSSDLSVLKGSDCVVVDFSAPEPCMNILQVAKEEKLSVVIGTTGFTEQQRATISGLSSEIAVLQSPNMSFGVNLLFYLTDLVSKKLAGQFDIEIIEAHHRFKKDSPSGTARKLGEIAASALDQAYDDAIRDGRSGMVGERTKNEIGMHAIRGGDIVGDHTVLYAGIGERIELRHVAHNRSNLAGGAVMGARWLSGKKPGMYSMQDVLNF